jgi:L-seryl-tRNA(Ser) seleniumtransferase
MKAGKEEIMGLLAAVEQWAKRDHEADWKQWEGYLQIIIDAISMLPTVQTTMRQPGRSNVAPVLEITWDQTAINISPQDVARHLSESDPRIELTGGDRGLSIMSYMMEPGDDAVVACRLCEVLGEDVGRDD